MKRILVLISGNGSNLQALLDQAAAGRLGGEVVAVISNKADAYGLERARAAGVATEVLPGRDFADRDSFDAALRQRIDGYTPDLVVLAGFMRILTPALVRHYEGRMLNIHPSLLPKYQGLNTHQRAIDAGDDEHGCSVHFVTEELDGGPVILQARVPVFADDDATTVAERVHVQEHAIYPLAVRWFCDGRLAMKGGQAWLDNQPLPPEGHAGD
ncbi:MULTISPECIES: phosphoribosylglycinamide formyltransferase [Oceanimonas]|uniref:Phosphoribosylglycinamide formyltransferase n=1 Tax=Oceanimonas doudoroffii TaxID=84158 RepID=A0A233RED4_9GAMM|nr:MULTISPECIES: phosphoribosylglycinamide formyltransferase [Oceanimonas]NHI01254.1 Phosphoribosylglycinamide formyltransferase [Oceanimonas sp. MB9]OXY81747.1 phosphoribosylglycinamide formyltransferase [Oceanimonas doudoroffii]